MRCVCLPPIFRVRQSYGVIWIYPLSTPVAVATIQKLQNFALQPIEISKWYNSVLVKDNCALFAPTPYFRAWAIRRCHLNFSPADPCCYSNKFLDKNWLYNSSPAKDNCTLFSSISYFLAWTMQWCHVNFCPEDHSCHGNQPFLIQGQNRLQACKSIKRWNAAARLYSMAMGQIPRSTERISTVTKFHATGWRGSAWTGGRKKGTSLKKALFYRYWLV